MSFCKTAKEITVICPNLIYHKSNASRGKISKGLIGFMALTSFFKKEKASSIYIKLKNLGSKYLYLAPFF